MLICPRTPIFLFSNIFFILLILFYFLFLVIVLLLFVCCLFFFLPHHVAREVLVPRLGVGPELLWWECRVQTTGLTENVRPQGMLIGVSTPRGPHLGTKTWLHPTTCKLQCWMTQAKQPAR